VHLSFAFFAVDQWNNQLAPLVQLLFVFLLATDCLISWQQNKTKRSCTRGADQLNNLSAPLAQLLFAPFVANQSKNQLAPPAQLLFVVAD